MPTDQDKLLESWLRRLGFEAEARPSLALWRLPLLVRVDAETSPRKVRGPRRVRLPWQLTSLELAERKGTLALSRLGLELARDALLANLHIVTRKFFGPRTNAEFVCESGGAIWCLFEFTRPGSRDRARDQAGTETPPASAAGELLPHGVAGFSFRISTTGAQAAIVVADYFGFGYVPSAFSAAPLRIVADALGLKGLADRVGAPLKSRSIYELAFSLADPALAVLAMRTEENGETAQALAEIRLALAQPRAPISSALLDTAAGWEVLAPFDEVDRRAVSSETSFVPLEVLESRERGERCRPIDQLIQAGKLGLAGVRARERLIDEPQSLYLMRRLSLVGLSSQPADESYEFLGKALETEPRNKLFLSFGINRALEAGDQARVLELLSRLGAELMGGIRGADALSCFDLVLPELLGDAWAAEDRRKAEECYNRVIQRRGDLPRILRKLIGLSKIGGRPETEIAYLHRLAKVERRRMELAKIYFRLAELRCAYKTGKEEAIELALRSLKLDRGHWRSALLAAELLVAENRTEEAIQLLDGLLRDQSVPLTPRARSRLEGMIGLVWARKLSRPDLAETRFETAVEQDPGHVEALRELEAIYRQNANVKGLVGLLERQFDAYEKLGDGESLRRVFDELVSLYRGILGQPKRAYELYQRLLASNAMEPEEVERVLAWRDVEIDWTDLYRRLGAKLPDIQAGERRGRFHCRLAEICREKLHDDEGAASHLIDALDDGWIDTQGFAFLVERLSAASDYPLLVRCYEQRLERVGDKGERRRLLLEFIAVPQGLSDAKRDLLAIKAHELDPTESRVVMQRLTYYQTEDDVDGVDRVLALVLEEKNVSTFQRNQWLKAGLDILQQCLDERRYEIMDRCYRALLASGEDQVGTLQEAIQSLKGGAQVQMLAYYATRLLNAGYIPPLDEKTMTRLLAGHDKDLALYHQLMSYKAPEPQIAAQHARTAAAILSSREGEEAATEKMLGRVCTLVPVADDDLQQLSGLVERSGNYAAMARALHKQAEVEDERGRKRALLERLGTLYWKKMRDYPRARGIYALVIRLAAEPWKMRLILAEVEAEAGDKSGEIRVLYEFLADGRGLRETSGLARVLARLAKHGENPSAVLKIMQPHVDAAVAAADFAHAGRLAQCLLNGGFSTTDLHRIAFRAAFATGDDDRAIEHWWRGLASSSNKAKAKTYIADTRLLLEKEGRAPLLLACFQAALANEVEAKLGPKLRQELNVLYGSLLFDLDSKRRKALGVFQEAYDADGEDNRTWMPLYFLLLEFGQAEDRKRHLEEILPRLELDPRPLKNFPITIESLRAELKELNDQNVELPQPASDYLKKGKALELDEDDEALPPVRMPVAKAATAAAPPASRAPLPLPKSPPARVPASAADAAPSRAPLPFPGSPAARAPGGAPDRAPASSPDAAPSRAPLPFPGVAPSGAPLPFPGVASSGAPLPFPGAAPADAPLPFPAAATYPSFPEGAAAADLGALDFQPHGAHEAEAESEAAITFSLDTGESDVAQLPQLSLAPPLGGAFSRAAAVPQADGFSLDLDLGAPAEEVSSVGLSLELGDAMPMPLPASTAASAAPPSMSLDLGDVVNFDLAAMVPPTGATFPPLLPEAAHGVPVSELGHLPDISHHDGGDASDEPVGLPPIPELPEGSQGSFGDGGATAVVALPEPPTHSTVSKHGTSSHHEDREGSAIGTGYGASSSDDLADWRAAVIKGDFNAELTANLLSQAFASEIEKHLAIQAVALVAGTCDGLANWHWRVWRNANEFGYPLNGKDRYPAGISPQILHSSLHKLLIAIAPLLVKLYRERFTLDYLSHRAGVTVAALERMRKPMSWQTGLLNEVGFKHYLARIAERNYRAFNLPGLGPEVFYEGGTRSIYLDETYYRRAPPSHLFHRILGILWSVRIHYFVPLALHPMKQVMPVLSELHQYFGAQGFSMLKTRFKSRGVSLSKHLNGLDTRQIKSLYEKVGLPTEDVVTQLYDAMKIHINRMLIAETLDLIGVFESLTNKDLLLPGALKHSQIYEMSPYARGLLEFVTKLKI